jgi:putative tryptophan/tyrosine transport system substrate-binding protein
MASFIGRRKFLATLGGAAAAWPLAARAQQHNQLRRVGVVMAYTESDPNGQLQVEAFRQQLQKLGWMEGANIQIDLRYAAADAARIRALARELLGLSPDVMVSNSNVVTTILQSEVHSIPLVFVSVSRAGLATIRRAAPADHDCGDVEEPGVRPGDRDGDRGAARSERFREY